MKLEITASLVELLSVAVVLVDPAVHSGHRGPDAEPGPQQGPGVELPDRRERPGVRGGYPLRPVHPAVRRPASPHFLEGNSNLGDAVRLDPSAHLEGSDS
jgi:hypothetical protein